MNEINYEKVNSKLNKAVASNALVRAELEEITLESFLPNRTPTDKHAIEALNNQGVGTLYQLYEYGLLKLKDIDGIGNVRFNKMLQSVYSELQRINKIYEVVQNLNFTIDANKINKLSGVPIGALYDSLFDRELSAFDDFDNFNIYDEILKEDLEAIINKPYMVIANHISIFRLYELANVLTAKDIVDLSGFDAHE